MQRTLGSGHEIYNDYARRLIRAKARHLSRRADFSRSDEEDLAQDLTLHLLSRANQFDPTRATVNTFVSLVIDSGVRIHLRTRGRRHQKPDNAEVQTLATMVDTPDGPPVALESLISSADIERRTGSCSQSENARHEAAEAFQHALSSLPAHLQRVCRQLMTESPARAATSLGVSRRKMRDWVASICEQFQQLELGRD